MTESCISILVDALYEWELGRYVSNKKYMANYYAGVTVFCVHGDIYHRSCKKVHNMQAATLNN